MPPPLDLQRKKRVIPADTASKDALATLQLASTVQPHGTKSPGIVALAPCLTAGHANLIATAGADRIALIFDVNEGRVVGRLGGAHAKRVNDIAWSPSAGAAGGVELLFTASADGLVRAWAPDAKGSGSVFARTGTAAADFSVAASIRAHGGRDALSVSLHPLGTHGVSAGADGSWAFWDVVAERVLATVPLGSGAAPTAIRVHPDGMLVALTAADGAVRIFDLRSQTVAATFEGAAPATSVAFSENGFHLASAGGDGIALRDLRKVGGTPLVATWSPGGAGVAATAVAFDAAGWTVAGGDASGAVAAWETRDEFAQVLKTVRHHSAAVSGLAWGDLSRSLVSSSLTERAVHVLRTK